MSERDEWSDTPWSDESTRELVARYYVNATTTALLRMTLPRSVVPADCERCGIAFLAMRKGDTVCHVCFGERLASCECAECAE